MHLGGLPHGGLVAGESMGIPWPKPTRIQWNDRLGFCVATAQRCSKYLLLIARRVIYDVSTSPALKIIDGIQMFDG